MGKVFIQESTLTAIGNSIREKAGTTDLISPLNMADAIINLPSGGGDGSKTFNLHIAGDSPYFDYNGRFDDLLKDTSGMFKWSSESIGAMKYGFASSKITRVPFVLNFEKQSSAQESGVEDLFSYCQQLTTMPVMKGSVNGWINNLFNGCSKLDNVKFEDDFTISTNSSSGINMNAIFQDCTNLKTLTGQFPACDNGGELKRWQYFFANCYNLREIPLDFFDKFKSTYGGVNYDVRAQYLFTNCYSLRQYPNINFGLRGSKSYYEMFNGCHSLDEVRDLGVENYGLSSQAFTYTFSGCSRLKAFTFETNEDGTAKTAKWSNQIIDLSRVGYAFDTLEKAKILNYNSGITADKEVTYDINDTSYNALKNDPDWFTMNRAYCRYNLDSAIETINSLPDCSATGTNTITFDQYQGQHTDAVNATKPNDGAIGNLTDAQIAVAAAKGWTVSLK